MLERRAPALTIFEEPENGLYVGHLERVFDLLLDSAGHTQFVITTHSPHVIDYFDGHPEYVHLVTRDESGSKVASPDPQRLNELLEMFSLGELHFREMLPCESGQPSRTQPTGD
jgi:predicted ATPase